MSRFSILLLLILAAVVGLVIFLATVDTEVPPVRVEKAMLNDATPQ